MRYKPLPLQSMTSLKARCWRVAKVSHRRRLPAGQMNKLETEYAQYLDLCKIENRIVYWWFEPLKLRIGKACYYTPDFMVQMADDTIEMREVKGFWEDDARVKIKAVAERYPFRFVAVKRALKRDGGGWKREEI